MARHLARYLFPRVLVAGLITVALTALFSLPDNTAHADGSFDTTTEYFFCNHLPDDFRGPAPLPGNPSCASNYSPGANPDWGFTWEVASGDYNFSTFAIFMSDDFSIAADAAIDDGTVIGGIRAGVTLGIVGNSCSNWLSPSFILYDSTTDTSNTVDALPEGTADRFINLKTDDVPDGAGPNDDFADQADADSPAVLQYPSFLNTLLDPDLDYPGAPSDPPDPDLDPISPHARYTGLTKVGGTWIFLAILVFEKTQLGAFTDDADNATNPLARYGRNPNDAGWVYVLVLQDPMETTGRVDSISDFCSPLVTDAMFLGSPGGTPRLTSPAANSGIDNEGTNPLSLYAMTVRDTDGDGLENSLDTCPFAANLEDPRATSGGSGPWGIGDLDMIDPTCDPTPNVDTEGAPANQPKDHDGDGFTNSQDNCPLAANVSQAQGEETTTYLLAAPDAGWNDDSIGDACDSEFGLGNGVDDDVDGRIDEDPANGVNDDADGLTDEDGAGAVGNTPDESGLPLGSDAVGDGGFLHDMNTDAVCIGGIDTTPADGFCDAGGLSADDIDTDGDGHPNDNEIFMQTDPLVDCPLVSTSHDAWPPDFDQNRVINISDVFKVLPPAFGSSTGQPNYSKRADLAPNGVINISDVFKVLPPVFGTSCTP